MLFKIRVVNKNYEKISIGQIILRETVGKTLSQILFSLGFLWIIFDEKSQGWHDKIAKTYVVHTEPVPYDEIVRQKATKTYSLSTTLILSGIIEIGSLSLFASILLPTLIKLSTNLNIGNNLLLLYLLFALVASIALTQIVYGLFLKKFKKTSESFHRKISYAMIILGLLLFYLLIPFTFIFTISSTLNSIKTGETKPLKRSVTLRLPTPTPDLYTESNRTATANWKTYTNIKYGYSVKYPSDWLALSPGGQYGDKCVNSTDKDDIIELAQKTLDYCGFVGEQLPNSDAEFTIWVLDRPWKKEEILTTDEIGTDISKDIVLAGEKATKTPFTEKSAVPNIQATRVYFNHDGKGYLIFIKQTDKKGNYDPVFGQILSTFKFLNEENQVACTQEAKLCPDGSYVSRQPPNCEFTSCP